MWPARCGSHLAERPPPRGPECAKHSTRTVAPVRGRPSRATTTAAEPPALGGPGSAGCGPPAAAATGPRAPPPGGGPSAPDAGPHCRACAQRGSPMGSDNRSAARARVSEPRRLWPARRGRGSSPPPPLSALAGRRAPRGTVRRSVLHHRTVQRQPQSRTPGNRPRRMRPARPARRGRGRRRSRHHKTPAPQQRGGRQPPAQAQRKALRNPGRARGSQLRSPAARGASGAVIHHLRTVIRHLLPLDKPMRPRHHPRRPPPQPREQPQPPPPTQRSRGRRRRRCGRRSRSPRSSRLPEAAPRSWP